MIFIKRTENHKLLAQKVMFSKNFKQNGKCVMDIVFPNYS